MNSGANWSSSLFDMDEVEWRQKKKLSRRTLMMIVDKSDIG